MVTLLGALHFMKSLCFLFPEYEKIADAVNVGDWTNPTEFLKMRSLIGNISESYRPIGLPADLVVSICHSTIHAFGILNDHINKSQDSFFLTCPDIIYVHLKSLVTAIRKINSK